MIALALDCSTDTFGASISEDGALIGEFRYQRPRSQLMHIFPEILQMMRVSGVGLRKINLIGVTTGPGSFTGVRLGIITARTIAQILGIPVASINTLDAIAGNIQPWGNKIICVLLDARRNEIFASFYSDRGGVRTNISGYRAYTIESLIEYILRLDGDLIATGNALLRYGQHLRDIPGGRLKLLPRACWYPGGGGMHPLILVAYESGKTRMYHEISAFYMRKSDAEEKLESQEKK